MSSSNINLNRRYFQIKSQHDGVCKECAVPVYRGEQAVWDSEDRKLFCVPCGSELMEGEQK